MKMNVFKYLNKTTFDSSKGRDGRAKMAAMLSGIGITLIAVSLSGPASAATCSKTLTGNTGTMQPGASLTFHWNNASATATGFVDVSPKGAGTFSSPVQFEVVRQWTQQVLNPPVEREIWYTIKNVGSFPGSADIYLLSCL